MGKTNYYQWFNGWGTKYYRTAAGLYNYCLSSGRLFGQSSSDFIGKYCFNDNVKATVTMFMPSGVSGNGATMIVENEGYATFSANSTVTTGTPVTDNVEYDMALFTRKQEIPMVQQEFLIVISIISEFKILQIIMPMYIIIFPQ